jgi:hypothetical protein
LQARQTKDQPLSSQSKTKPEGWKMDVSPINNGSRLFNLFAQPFHILGVDPTATNVQVFQAFDLAIAGPLASKDLLVSARAAILDRSQCLSHELSYLLDSGPGEIAAIYFALSSYGSVNELLLIADRLPPLTRSNFVAHIAANLPANTAVLQALIRSHVSVDALTIYEILKTVRRTAGCPEPSLWNVNQGLEELFILHADAAIARYETIQDAISPMSACTQQILELGEFHQIEVLTRILRAYSRSVGQQPSARIDQIERACAALHLNPTDVGILADLVTAMRDWVSLWRPLILLDIREGFREKAFDIPTVHVRALVAHLTIHRHYDLALKVVDLTREALSVLPTTVDQLDEDKRVIERLSLNEKMKPLCDLIDGLDSDLRSLNQALEENGFGQNALQPARHLWEIFLQTVKQDLGKEADRPWMLVRDLALSLGHRAEFFAGASALLVDLIKYGEMVSVASEILIRLRDDLKFIERNQMKETNKTVEQNQSPRPEAFENFWKRTSGQKQRQNFQVSIGQIFTNKRRRWLLILVLSGVLCAVRGIDVKTMPPFWLDTGQKPSSEQGANATAPEIMPPVLRGEHFSQGNVRYCRFQEERLRLIKEEVQGPEDVGAFNLLAVDYNSRCSDFFYQESDLKIVMAEVIANKSLLEADAKRIVSAWPWHGSPDPATLRSKQGPKF